MTRLVTAVFAGLLCALPNTALAQAAPDSRLSVSVVDPGGGVLVKATVTVTGLDDVTKAAPAREATTSPQGLAAFDALKPGRYSIRAEYQGFEPGLLKDVRLRAGDNKHVLVLALKRVEDAVTVGRDAQAAATDPKTAFRTVLTREEINALSDDPAEMMLQLLDMAGGSASFRVDGFSGGPLPPKAMIKSIHIVRDTFAAENHSAEIEEIDIITQPGIGPLRGGLNTRFRDGSMSGRSPFTPTKGPEHNQNVQGNLGGTLAKEKSSFSVSVSSGAAFDTPVLNVALPNGNQSQVLGLRRPTDTWSTYALLDYALTRDHTLRLSYDQSHSSRKNLGVGAYDLPERAFATDSGDREIRIQENGPMGRRSFLTTRLQLTWTDSKTVSAIEGPTIRVLDSFTSGGAQSKGGSHPRDFEFASDLDYIRGAHSVRVGVLSEGGHYRNDSSANYFGTYVFSSLEAFDARQPAQFTLRVGDPLVQYWNVRTGFYAQDDIRVNKALVLSPGLRYEFQTHVPAGPYFAPRMGVTWAPFKSGRTSLRTSYGLFYNWLNSGVYEQTLRIDGEHQKDITVVDPSFPSTVDGSATALATNRYLLSEDLQFVRTQRFSAGIDQTLSKKLKLSATFSDTRQSHILRGQNLNPPVNGVRPNPLFANVIEAVSDGEQRAQQLSTTLTVNMAGGSRTANQGRLNWRRHTIRVSYWLAKAENNSDGAFVVPASGTLDTEWGPTNGDQRHRVSLSISSQALKNLNASLTMASNTGTPYNITTGADNNGDLFFNDRPAGTQRNSVRTAAPLTLSLNASYQIPFGAPSPGASPRYRLSLTANAANLTNHANYTGYSGVMTSRFFQQATAVSSVRRIDLGVSLTF